MVRRVEWRPLVVYRDGESMMCWGGVRACVVVVVGGGGGLRFITPLTADDVIAFFIDRANELSRDADL